MDHFGSLACDGSAQVRMSVSQRIHRHSGHGIQILASLRVIQAYALAMGESNRLMAVVFIKCVIETTPQPCAVRPDRYARKTKK